MYNKCVALSLMVPTFPLQALLAFSRYPFHCFFFSHLFYLPFFLQAFLDLSPFPHAVSICPQCCQHPYLFYLFPVTKSPIFALQFCSPFPHSLNDSSFLHLCLLPAYALASPLCTQCTADPFFYH